jgi:hypothetical protein
MNADHGGALSNYCPHFYRREAASVAMIGIDCDGFDLRADDEVMRFDFGQPVVDARAARAALTSMATEARGS